MKSDQQKLEELDPRWSFEKQVKSPRTYSWDQIRERFNELQDTDGDLYMSIGKSEENSRMDVLRLKYREFRYEGAGTAEFQHKQVYDWFRQLALELDCTVGRAVHKVFTDLEGLRKSLDLGKSVNVDITSLGDVDTSDSTVSKDELQSMINDE